MSEKIKKAIMPSTNGIQLGTALSSSTQAELDKIDAADAPAKSQAEEVKKAEVPAEEVKKAEVPTTAEQQALLAKQLFTTIHSLKDGKIENDATSLEEFAAKAKAQGLNTESLQTLLASVKSGDKQITKAEAVHIERITLDELVDAKGKALSAESLQKIVDAFPKSDAHNQYSPYNSRHQVDKAEAVLDPRLAWFEHQVDKELKQAR